MGGSLDETQGHGGAKWGLNVSFLEVVEHEFPVFRFLRFVWMCFVVFVFACVCVCVCCACVCCVDCVLAQCFAFVPSLWVLSVFVFVIVFARSDSTRFPAAFKICVCV